MSPELPASASVAAEREAGRTCPPAVLRRRLTTAPAPFLDGALENPAVGEAEIALLLQNRVATPETLGRIAGDPRWNRRHVVRARLVRHPSAPLTLARRLVPLLFWKDLAETAADLRVHPLVRRQAETTLRLRLEGMALGERISLARRATRGVIAALLHTDDGRVLDSLLDNPRLTEGDRVTIATSPRTPAPVLLRLARGEAGASRPAIRQGLLRNPRTPIAAALRLVARCDRQELRALIRDAKVPKIVRTGAERRLGGPGRVRPDAAGRHDGRRASDGAS